MPEDYTSLASSSWFSRISLVRNFLDNLSWKTRVMVVILATGLGISFYGFQRLFFEINTLSSREHSQVAASTESTALAGKNRVFVAADDSQLTSFGQIVVDVSGAVENPGVYKLESGQRVADALDKAGGVSAEADLSFVSQQVNLAEELVDQGKIYIPFYLKPKSQQPEVQIATSTSTTQSLVSTSPASPIDSTQNKISLNSATKSELMQLDGVGEKRAAAVMLARPFLKLEDVVTKKAITQNLFDKIKSELRL